MTCALSEECDQGSHRTSQIGFSLHLWWQSELPRPIPLCLFLQFYIVSQNYNSLCIKEWSDMIQCQTYWYYKLKGIIFIMVKFQM